MKKFAFVTLMFLIILSACTPKNAVVTINQPQPAPVDTAVAPSVASIPTPKPTHEPTTAPVPTQPSTGAAQGKVPNFDHIVLIVLENRDYEGVIGNNQMPHLNALAKQNVLLTQYFAIRHPSLPNYIALMSGDTYKISKDCKDCFLNEPNLADEIEASSRTWKSYLEDMPSPCFLGDSKPYAQKHNPLLYFDSVRLDAARCQRSIVPLTQLDSDLTANQLPNFSFIMPNMCNSGHDCSPDIADTWVNNMVMKLQSSSALGKNSLIIVVFDEGGEENNSTCCNLGSKAGGRIAAVLISPQAKPGFTDGAQLSHYSMLKTILSAWNLPDLGWTSKSGTLPITAPWIQ